MGTDNFCLRWNDFESNISTSFVEIRESQEFFDVVLSCEFGEEQIEAHKVVLAACSPFFRRILARNPHKKPIIYLKGIDYENLAAILNFMYHGEVNVSQEDLPSFLRVAEELAVKGLTDNGSGNQSNSNSKSHLNHHSSGNNSLANQQQQLLNQSVLQQSNTLINSLLAQTNKSSSQNGATNNGSNFSPSALAAQKVQRQRRQHPNLDLLLSGMNKRPIGSGINNNTTQNTLLNKTNLLNAGVGGGNGGGRNNNTNMTNMLLNSVLANNNLTQPPVQKKSRQQSEQSKQQDAVISLANSILLQQRQNNAAQAAASSTPPVMGTPSATTVSSSSSLTAVSSAASSLPFGFNIKPISPSKLKTDMQSAPIPSLAQTLATGGVGSIGGDDDMTDQEELILDVPNQDELVVNDMEDEEEMNGTVVRQNNTGDSGLGGGQGSNPDDIIADDDSESGHSMGGQPVDPSEYLDSGEAVLTVGNGESLLNSIKSESNMGRTQILNPEISESDGGKDHGMRFMGRQWPGTQQGQDLVQAALAFAKGESGPYSDDPAVQAAAAIFAAHQPPENPVAVDDFWFRQNGYIWCNTCGFNSASKTDVTRHIEARHFSPGYSCPYCGIETKTKMSLNKHMKRKHIDEAAALISMANPSGALNSPNSSLSFLTSSVTTSNNSSNVSSPLLIDPNTLFANKMGSNAAATELNATFD